MAQLVVPPAHADIKMINDLLIAAVVLAVLFGFAIFYWRKLSERQNAKSLSLAQKRARFSKTSDVPDISAQDVIRSNPSFGRR